jgi:hypothetical protein
MERNSILLQIFRRSVVLILFLLPVSIYAQSGIVITGKITDSAGEPLPGAAVLISGQKGGGTVADIDGIYSITVPSKDSQLQYVFLGYEEKTLTPGNRTVVNVVLEESVETLESAAVVAIGYGEVRKKDISGSVSLSDALSRAKSI